MLLDFIVFNIYLQGKKVIVGSRALCPSR